LKGGDLLKLSQLKLEVSEQATSLISDFLLGLGSQGVAEDIRENGMYEVSAYFPMDRLMVRPETTLCIDCKEEQEIEEKQFGL